MARGYGACDGSGMPATHGSAFERQQMANCLMGQARLCERIARACLDQERAQKFKRLARECRDAAAREMAPAAGGMRPGPQGGDGANSNTARALSLSA